MGKVIKVGFIGTGNIADLHAEAVCSLENVVLLGVWNRTYDTAVIKAKKYGCKVFSDVDELIHHPDVDVLFILTNMETHSKYAIEAAKAGKHVLIEKPVASNVRELEEIKDAVNNNGVKCMPVHNYIYEPGVCRIKEMIEENKLGQITQFYMMYNIRHVDEVRKRYPGVVHQMLTHHIYSMLYLVGEPESISCMSHRIGRSNVPQEDVAMSIMKMKNGALSHLSASYANDDHAGDPWTCMIKVMGTRGSARYSYRDWVINERNGPHSQTYYCYPESIKNVDKYFINEVLFNQNEPLSSLKDAIKVENIVGLCSQSATEGRILLADI